MLSYVLFSPCENMVSSRMVSSKRDEVVCSKVKR